MECSGYISEVENRITMRRVVEWIAREIWEVCLSVAVEDEYRVAVMHGRKHGVLLRGEALWYYEIFYEN